MLDLRRALKDFREAGAPSEHVPLWGFLGDGSSFLTKAGDVGAVLRVRGIDYECLDDNALSMFTERLANAFKLFQGQARVYQYLFKTPLEEIPHRGDYADPVVTTAVKERVRYFREKAVRLHNVEAYYVVVQNGPRYDESWSAVLDQALTSPSRAAATALARFSGGRQTRLVLDDIRDTQRALLERLHLFVTQVDDFLGAEVLPKDEAFKVLLRLLNVDPVKRQALRLKYNRHLDWFVCNSALEFRSDAGAAMIDDYHVRVLTLAEPTKPKTWPLILKGLYEVPGAFHVVLEWNPLPNEVARAQIRATRKHRHNSKAGPIELAAAEASGTPQSQDILVDEAKVADADVLGQALVELDHHGNHFGELALSIVVYDRDPGVVRRTVAEFYKLFSAYEATLLTESLNLPHALFATIPGNHQRQLRSLLMSNKNHASYSFLFTLSSGELRNEYLDDEYNLMLETQQGTTYALNPHVGDVGHSATLGRVGSGKSFWEALMLTHAQKYRPVTYVFELGGSFRGITELFGGSYIRVGDPDTPVTINPFALPDTKRNRNFLLDFLQVLMEDAGRAPLSIAERTEIDECLKQLYVLPADRRTLGTLRILLGQRLGERLHLWTKGGAYDFVFDNPLDTLTFNRFQTYDFEALGRKYAAVLPPLLFYVLHRASDVIDDPALDGVFKIFVIDEFAQLSKHPLILDYALKNLLGGRKRNLAVWLATQSVDELLKTGSADPILDSCPTKFFLANPDMDRDLYKQRFHLNDREMDAVVNLRPKGQVFLKRSGMAKVLNVNVDRKSYWLYTQTPKDNVKRAEAIKRYGFAEGLEFLARSTE